MVDFSRIKTLRREWALFRSQAIGKWFLLLLLVVLVYQTLAQRNWVDTAEYIRKAQSLFRGWQELEGDRILEQSRRTPTFGLLLLLLGPLYTWFSGLLALLFVLNVRIWVREMSSYQQAPYWATVFLMLHPLLLIYAVVPMPEMLCMVLLLSWFRAASGPCAWSLSLYGGALLAIKPAFVVLVPLSLLAAYMLPRAQKSGLWAVKSLAIPIVVYALFWWGNSQSMGVGHFSSMGLSNAVEYNLPAYDATYSMPESDLDPAAEIARQQHEIRSVLQSHLFDAVLIHARGIIVGLLDPGRYDLWSFLGAKGDMGVMKAINARTWPSAASWGGLLYIAVGAMLNVLFVLVAIRGIWAHRAYRQHAFFVLFALVWLGLVGPVASARYTLLLYPVLALWFADGWLSIRNTSV